MRMAHHLIFNVLWSSSQAPSRVPTLLFPWQFDPLPGHTAFLLCLQPTRKGTAGTGHNDNAALNAGSSNGAENKWARFPYEALGTCDIFNTLPRVDDGRLSLLTGPFIASAQPHTQQDNAKQVNLIKESKTVALDVERSGRALVIYGH
ncbi:hypothetical protein BDQ17DRAFT_668338 [Cyathus striatus]|nr:hypothetical protein BDQ17DRAFT_668338 [Cyathus striatus]